MKSFYFITILFSCYFSNAQTITGVYNTYILRSTNSGQEVSKESKKPLITSYVFHKNKSLQRIVAGGGTIIKDTLVIDEYGKEHAVAGKIHRPTDAFFYKNFDTNLYRVESNSSNDRIAIEDEMPQYDWKIHAETKIILGYTCKKATTESHPFTKNKRNIVAWYTEEIPISDGPTNYSGLPGLILEVEIDIYTVMKFEKLELLPNVNVAIEEPQKNTPPLTISQFKIIYGN